MQSGQHGRALIGQMLLDARAEAEMRAIRIEEERSDVGVADMLGEGAIERADHLGIDKVRLRPFQPQPQPQQTALRFAPNLERRGHAYLVSS